MNTFAALATTRPAALLPAVAVAEEWREEMTFRILSLDGGGTWAMLQAMALEDMFPNASGKEILQNFDLAAANSGGSIVLAGLMLDMAPKDIIRLFSEKSSRSQIFRKKWISYYLLKNLSIFPRYFTWSKRTALHTIMKPTGDISLSELPKAKDWPIGPSGAATKCLIVAFNYDTLREDFLRTYSIANTGSSASSIHLADAVHASTNAPVSYFDRPAAFEGSRFWDGAMGGYNNPLLGAIVDALALGVPAHEIIALSIGTGTVRLLDQRLASSETPSYLVAPNRRAWWLRNVQRAAETILDDPPDAATYISHIVLGHHPLKKGPVVRLNPIVRPVRVGDTWRRPTALPEDDVRKLIKLDMDATREQDVKLIERLGNAWIKNDWPNQAIRMRSDLGSDPGDDTYREGLNRWRKLAQVRASPIV